MANYKEIQGFPIQNLSSDPVPFAQAKENNPYAGVWSSGTNLPSTRFATGASGIQTAMILTGGQISPPKQALNTSYDGTTWTELTDMTTARSHHAMSASGPSSATLAISGEIDPGFTANTESWNGSAWTEVNDVNTARGSLTGVGIQTLALVAGGQTPPRVASVELWDGSSWTETTDMSNASNSRGGAGSQTSAIVFAGRLDPPASNNYTAAAEVWNGTSWTEVNDLNTAREFIGSAGQAPTGSNEALGYGGDTPSRTGATESWNGSSWTEVNDMATARRIYNGGCGTGTAALASGGVITAAVDTVEEWTFSGIPPTAPAAGYSDAITGQMYYNSTTGQFKAIKTGGAPIGTWASGGSLNTARTQISGGAVGTQTATIFAGGLLAPGAITNSEEYNGTSWTETADLNFARFDMLKFGTSTAAFHCGGEGAPVPARPSPPSTMTDFVESWNGSTWTETTNMPGIRRTGCGAGTTAAGIVFMGNIVASATKTNTSVEWNGSSWSAGGSANTARRYFAGYGTQTAAHAVGGFADSPASSVAFLEEYNGTSWTELSDLNTARESTSGSGISTDSLVYGGNIPPTTAVTEYWNGSSWTEVNDMATARQYHGSAGNSSISGLAFGSSPATAATEEFTADDFQIKTMTTS